LVEMKELHTQQVCKMFPLDIPWFRYEKGQHLESQYGVSPNLLVCEISSLSYYLFFHGFLITIPVIH
jgi:hypothetical protein